MNQIVCKCLVVSILYQHYLVHMYNTELKSDGDVNPLKHSTIPGHECIVIVYLCQILSWLMTESHDIHGK